MVAPYFDATGGSYFVLAQLIAEDYEALGYHESWDKLMPVIEKIMHAEVPEKESVSWMMYYHIESNLSECDIVNMHKSVIQYLNNSYESIE